MSAQRKSKDGLVKVLFVRVDEEMLADNAGHVAV